MLVTKATFSVPSARADPAWLLELNVEGAGFRYRALQLLAQVGAVPVEALFIKPNGDGFIGMLKSLPTEGTELEIGYQGEGMVGTGFLYKSSVVV
jgi:hypothetical protein